MIKFFNIDFRGAKYENEAWYKLYNKIFKCKGDIRKIFIEEYNDMIIKINEGLI